MFVRVKKIGPYEYLYLVENAREGGRHVQRVIKALGRRDEVENSDLLDGLIASAARHSRRSIVLSSFYRGELAELRRRSIGPDLVFGRLWQETGCRDVLRRLLADRRLRLRCRAGHLPDRAAPADGLRLRSPRQHDWQQRLRIPGAEALTLKQAYKAMAWLGEDDRRPAVSRTAPMPSRKRSTVIASRCSASSRSPSSTPPRCISRARAAPRSASGASPRTSARSCTRWCWASCWTRHDRPIASFLWPGNTADVTTLLPVVERLRSRFGIGRACVVADRGMISAATIAGLEAQGIDYILGVRERSTARGPRDGHRG